MICFMCVVASLQFPCCSQEKVQPKAKPKTKAKTLPKAPKTKAGASPRPKPKSKPKAKSAAGKAKAKAKGKAKAKAKAKQAAANKKKKAEVEGDEGSVSVKKRPARGGSPIACCFRCARKRVLNVRSPVNAVPCAKCGGAALSDGTVFKKITPVYYYKKTNIYAVKADGHEAFQASFNLFAAEPALCSD